MAASRGLKVCALITVTEKNRTAAGNTFFIVASPVVFMPDLLTDDCRLERRDRRYFLQLRLECSYKATKLLQELIVVPVPLSYHIFFSNTFFCEKLKAASSISRNLGQFSFLTTAFL